MAVKPIGICLVMCAVFVTLALSADKPTLRKHTAWIVAPEHTGEIKIRIDDLVQIDSEKLPVIHTHLGKTFSAKLNGRCLQMIGRLPPGGEGSFAASFYFQAVSAGPTTVTVTLSDAQGTQLQTWDYAVLVERSTT